MNFRIYPILYSNCTQQRKKEIKPLGVPRGSGFQGVRGAVGYSHSLLSEVF